MTEQHNNVTWSGILKWLPTFFLIATLLIGGATFRAENAETKVRLEEYRVEMAELETEYRIEIAGLKNSFVEIKVTLAEIQRDILYVREALAKEER